MQGPKPYGWDWPLRASEHALERMKERNFNALDVRMMMHRPGHISASPGTNRWILDAQHRGRSWRVILDPDPNKGEMVIVTAYPLGRRR